MTETGTDASNLDLIGGVLCLDFANTADDHASDQPYEWLRSYDDLIAWNRHAGVLDNDAADAIGRQAAQRPAEATAAWQRALQLRDVIYRVFSAIAAGQPAPADDLALLNAALAEALAHARIVPVDDGFAWGWAESDALDRLLWPVLKSAADLLTEGRLERVRECSNGTCGWLFLDTSRSGRRRWCSMEGCGNRAKARRHYQRQRSLHHPKT